ncbi:MAG: nicotinate-nucleotide diphosphorylase (carboxylating), partial [Candidatus Omnitrophica bacterium CG_4_9_14_0_2_um_filter_42_8]
KAGPDIIMLDNMSVKEIGKAVLLRAQSAARPAEPKGAGEHRVQKRPLLEVSGGVTLNRIRRIAKTGVDRISIGALTSSAKPLSFRLDIIR